jgi:ketosteroid isomerase-like protein
LGIQSGRLTGRKIPGQSLQNLNKSKVTMKRTSIWCLLGALLLMSSAGAQEMQNTSGTEKAVAALELQWLQSQKTNNPELVVPLLADRFVSTAPDGKVSDKAQSLADAKATKWTSADYKDLKVTVFGDTAIATMVFDAKGANGTKAIDEHSRWTDTWVKMPSGKWQCVASHGSPIKM